MNSKKSTTPTFEGIRQVSDGWVKKYVLTYKMPDGNSYEYEAVSRKSLEEYERELRAPDAASKKKHPDAVCIVPVLDDGSVLLIREFRYALNDWIIAFPAGLVEPGEDVKECIARELEEETGYRLSGKAEDAVTLLPETGFSSAGMTDENVLVAKALVEPSHEQQLEQSEFIELFVLERSKIGEFLESNKDLMGTRSQLILEGMRKDGAFH